MLIETSLIFHGEFVTLFEKSLISVDKSGIGRVIHGEFVTLATGSL
jgi:hypothetical protein